ncbi:MAG: ADP-ribosylglycohydrolase family protein [Steroidobacteraceae bacterium]|nr:ADP-ribosylglycohydrolase family protein [Steroidobacteraceae bacterium]
MPNVRKPVAESYWVIPDRLLAGRYPGGKNPRETERCIAAFVESGFDTFLDLTEAGELPSYDIYLPGRAEHFRRPIPDHGVPRAPEHMTDALAVLRKALAAGRRVYVHCRAGIGRTGTVVACHLMDGGLAPRDALIRLNELWQDNERSHSWPDVPETDEQRDYILNWVTPPAPSTAARAIQGARLHEPAKMREPEMPPRFEIPEMRADPPPVPVSRWRRLGAKSKDRLEWQEPGFLVPRDGEPTIDASSLDAPSSLPQLSIHAFDSLGPSPTPSSAPPAAAAEPDPMQAPDVLDAARTLRERFQGALVGLAVGDALAAHTQFRKPGTFVPVGDLLGGGPFDLPRGAWTDDTAMALLLGESLIEREGFDGHDQIARFARWQREGYGSSTGQSVGISASVARALAMAQYKRQPFAGSHDPDHLEKDPLSRVAPAVMYFFADAKAAVTQASEAARITVQAPMALDCVRLFAAMLHQALSGRDKAAVLRPPRALWESPSTRPEVFALYDGAWARRPATEITGGGNILQALEAALWCFQRSANYREGALFAANLGRDSDVVAAVYGQLAGAHHGVSAIPGIWRNSLMKHEVIIDTADRLLTHALVTLGS